MTVLENEVIPMQLCYSNNNHSTDHMKRKYSSMDIDIPAKKQLSDLEGNMLNGLRSDQRRNVDNIQEAPVASLSNMGNTCYLNSVLYTLRFAPSFLHNLHHLIGDLSLVNTRLSQNRAKTSSLGRNIGAISGPNSRSSSSSSKDFFTTASESVPKSKVQIVTEKLHDLFITMHNLELKDSTDPYQPVALLNAVREANTIFEGNHQQDAHELLLYLLDNIRETCDFLSAQLQHNPDLLNEAETASSSSSGKIWGVRRSWKKIQSKKERVTKEAINEEAVNESIFPDVGDTETGASNEGTQRKMGYNFLAEDFEGITLVRITCLECEGVTERKEPFYDIPVPIVSEDDFDIAKIEDISPNELYRNACVTSEKLCDSNKYLCEQCKHYNEACREVLFERLPNMMILQLKRFNTSTSGVHKVNTYLPTPLQLDCFCESCCNFEDVRPPHYYKLCCIIMHLGGTMASGHYITYVKASNYYQGYRDCSRDLPKNSLSASCSEKSLNILKYLKPRAVANSFMEAKNGISSKNILSGLKICKSINCCSVRLNKNVLENELNTQIKKNDQEDDMWLECDDESIRYLKSDELTQILGYKPNSTATPYLLFYTKFNMKSEGTTD